MVSFHIVSGDNIDHGTWAQTAGHGHRPLNMGTDCGTWVLVAGDQGPRHNRQHHIGLDIAMAFRWQHRPHRSVWPWAAAWLTDINVASGGSPEPGYPHGHQY